MTTRMRPLFVLDRPDALGETWCWRFSLSCYAAGGVTITLLVARATGGGLRRWRDRAATRGGAT